MRNRPKHFLGWITNNKCIFIFIQILGSTIECASSKKKLTLPFDGALTVNSTGSNDSLFFARFESILVNFRSQN